MALKKKKAPNISNSLSVVRLKCMFQAQQWLICTSQTGTVLLPRKYAIVQKKELTTLSVVLKQSFGTEITFKRIGREEHEEKNERKTKERPYKRKGHFTRKA